MILVGLIGANGRMGQAFIEYSNITPDLEVCAAIDKDDAVTCILDSQPDVVLDLSLGAAVSVNGPVIVGAALPCVIGATGVTEQTLQTLSGLADENGTPVLLVPNFSLGANLMMKFAELAARFMQTPVITERHHDRKIDAPSGTALHTAERINSQLAEGSSGPISYQESCQGVLGGLRGDVRLHSVRGPGYLAEQEVCFSLPGETLAIEHRSIDRRCFMAGIDYAIRNIGKVQGLQIGLDIILDI